MLPNTGVPAATPEPHTMRNLAVVVAAGLLAAPALGQSALYAFTEVVTQDDIDTLADALAAVTAR